MAEKIDPWSSNLIVDYEKLFSEFGMQKFDEKTRKKLAKSHLFRRGIVFGHRDADKWIEAAEKKKQVAVMSGIKPSGEFHLGSKLTAEEMIFLQSEFGAKVFYAIADLEAYADNELSLEDSRKNAISNLADFLALGLDEKNAYIWRQSRERRVMNTAYILSKKVTLATLQALYGDKSLGLYFASLTQAGDILLPQDKEFGGPKHVIVPVGADQDPHIRLTRDVAAKLGLVSPSGTFHKFFRSLSGENKMSKREELGMLTLVDDDALVKKKVMSCLTGGRTTWEEQKKIGGEPEKCVNYELAVFHFRTDDKDLEEMRRKCVKGEISCGDCKKQLLEQKILPFYKEHRERKKKMIPRAEKILEKEEGLV
ncbi:Tryptophan--tRNA ligase [Candidatus Gugararchaeum adminiculabundum]|nr:Tryptophan--tRNA ligase [Candidatus Gugararchaeum adminiculabundum]